MALSVASAIGVGAVLGGAVLNNPVTGIAGGLAIGVAADALREG
ncbi:hypothetical protein [Pseudorhizobium marinum]|nr:hypothetical protein [Pseudorhizobium marinum]